jgi:hypothetical protein
MTVRVVDFDETLAVNRDKTVSVEYVAGTSSIAKRVLVLLEGSRVLYGSRSGEDEDYCRQSAQRIRRKLEAEIVAANPPLEASRATTSRGVHRVDVDHQCPGHARCSRHQAIQGLHSDAVGAPQRPWSGHRRHPVPRLFPGSDDLRGHQ